MGLEWRSLVLSLMISGGQVYLQEGLNEKWFSQANVFEHSDSQMGLFGEVLGSLGDIGLLEEVLTGGG